ncbi:MAG: pyrroline-5-carboxylate reductase [Gammaproteobacteria bacterium]|nr:pyrroline-5-carboxylate reductase [Gammaproteobacteria bacterium]
MVRVAFIGAGNMASSLIGGLLRAGTRAQDLIAADPFAEQRNKLSALGVGTTADNARAVDAADAVVLAVKPQVMRDVVVGLEPHLPRDTLLISIAAGVTTTSITAWSRPAQPIVRCMPNTPALYGAGVTALFANGHVDEAQRSLAADILSAAGEVIWVRDESQLDAVTALSGSGPAYFFYLMEAMVAAGQRLGLDREVAMALTLATAQGSAIMARDSGLEPTQLRRNVTSPGGTTERAVGVLDDARVRQNIEAAIEQAAQRSRELAEQFGK